MLADGEKCCKLTDPFLKSSAASASTSANTANTTNVSDTAEPAHQGERQDSEEYEEDEEVDMDNCMMVRHVFIMERLALMIYRFVLCTGVVHCSGAVIYSMGVYIHHHWGYQQCALYVRQKLHMAPLRAAGG